MCSGNVTIDLRYFISSFDEKKEKCSSQYTPTLWKPVIRYCVKYITSNEVSISSRFLGDSKHPSEFLVNIININIINSHINSS